VFWPPHILSIPPAATSPERRARSEPTRPSWHPWRAAKGIIEFRRTCGQMRGCPRLGTKSQLDARLGVPASTRPNEGSCGAGEASAYLWYAGKEGGARSARRQTRDRACAAPALKARPQHLGQRRRSPCCGDDTMGHSRRLGWGVGWRRTACDAEGVERGGRAGSARGVAWAEWRVVRALCNASAEGVAPGQATRWRSTAALTRMEHRAGPRPAPQPRRWGSRGRAPPPQPG